MFVGSDCSSGDTANTIRGQALADLSDKVTRDAEWLGLLADRMVRNRSVNKSTAFNIVASTLVTSALAPVLELVYHRIKRS